MEATARETAPSRVRRDAEPSGGSVVPVPGSFLVIASDRPPYSTSRYQQQPRRRLLRLKLFVYVLVVLKLSV